MNENTYYCKTDRYIRRKEWDKLVEYHHATAPTLLYLKSDWVLYRLSCIDFTEEVWQVCLSVYGMMTPEQWTLHYITRGGDETMVRLLLQKGMLIPFVYRSNSDVCLRILQEVSYGVETQIEFLEELYKTGDINDRNETTGRSVLLAFIETVLFQQNNFCDEKEDEIISLEDANRLMRYLLEKGADPLLENKYGGCAWSVVCNCWMEEDLREEWLELMEEFL